MINLPVTDKIVQLKEKSFVNRQGETVNFYQIKLESLPNVFFNLSKEDYEVLEEGVTVDGFIELSEQSRVAKYKDDSGEEQSYVAFNVKTRFKLEE